LTVARAIAQTLAVLELPELVTRADRDVRVRADAERAAGGDHVARRRDAVAEVRLGHRAEARDRAARREALHF
jgi:hypothetical protein